MNIDHVLVIFFFFFLLHLFVTLIPSIPFRKYHRANFIRHPEKFSLVTILLASTKSENGRSCKPVRERLYT